MKFDSVPAINLETVYEDKDTAENDVWKHKQKKVATSYKLLLHTNTGLWENMSTLKVKAMNALGVGWIQKVNKLHHIYCCFATYFAISIWYTIHIKG